MTKPGERIPDSEQIFAAYSKQNPILAAHQAANDYQDRLRGASSRHEDMTPLITSAINELDNNCGHRGMPVSILGKVTLTHLDPAGVNFATKSFDSDAIVRQEHEFNTPITAMSLGYYVDPRQPITVTHVAKTGIIDAVESSAFGNMARENRIHIPIDGSAYVEPAVQIGGVRMNLLHHVAGDLMNDINSVFDAAENRVEALQYLSLIDLMQYPSLQTDYDVRYNLGRFLYESLGIKDEVLYTVSGADTLHIMTDSHGYKPYSIDPSAAYTGYIKGIITNPAEFNRISLFMKMPSDDNIPRQIAFELTDATAIEQVPALSFQPKLTS